IALLAGSPAIDAGSNPAMLTNDQRGSGFVREYGSAADIGAYEDQPGTAPFPLCVATNGVAVNGGDPQRSRVTSVRVDFTELATLPANPADAFQLQRQSDSALVGLTAAVSNDSVTHVTLTFGGALSDAGSLQDGRYTLKVVSAKVSNAN